MHMKYSFKADGEGYAFAQKYDLNASYKDLSEVCSSIRGKSYKDALALLEKAERMEVPIEFKRFNKKLGHRRELGGKKGRYPVKAVRIVKKVLLNAFNNAKVKRINEETLVVVHAAANKQKVYPRLAPKGRRMRWDYETARVEIVLKGEPLPIMEVTKAQPKEEKVDKPKEEAEKDTPKKASKKVKTEKKVEKEAPKEKKDSKKESSKGKKTAAKKKSTSKRTSKKNEKV